MLSVVALSALLGHTFTAAAAAGGGDGPGRKMSAWLETASTPEERAMALLQEMTTEEKVTLLHGEAGSQYVGYVAPVERLGIPALKLNDGPQGFRDNNYPGTTTSFPCGLSVGATWDEELAYKWGAAMGEEFAGKGTNVQLGPGMNVARVPVNGRNFEYISGGDPYLGYRMVQPVIRGIQDQHVIANAKHYVNNNQEADRSSVSENVDERTRQEMYYPPFLGAVEAGVGSFMCSYNKINDVYACENDVTLNQDLKGVGAATASNTSGSGGLGFKGWVMSDWGATHSTSIAQGLDQEMPGREFMGQPLLDMVNNGTLSADVVDAAAYRVLYPMFAVGLFDDASGDATEAVAVQSDDDWNHLADDVTSPEHTLVARQVGAASQVLLKNEGGLLPLSPHAGDKNRDESTPYRIAMFGGMARAPITGGGGSGAVFPSLVVSPYQGVLDEFGITDPAYPPTYSCSAADPSGNSTSTHTASPLMVDVGFDQSGCQSQPSGSVEECGAQCGVYLQCRFFTYMEGRCYLYPTDGRKRPQPASISGECVKSGPGMGGEPAQWVCNEENSVCVAVIDGDDLKAARALASEADVSIVAVGSYAKEGFDRDNLSFSRKASDRTSMCQLAQPYQDELVSAVASSGTPTVVVMAAGGAALTPWRDEVAAVIHGFYPGQEYGHSLADVMFGHTAPSGKLPMTMPNVENEVRFSPQQYPGVELEGNYSEKLEVDYRWYQAHGVEPAYCFGHGLSYTTFEYGPVEVVSFPSPGASAAKHELTLSVTNTGKRAGAEVVQLYLSFPAEPAAATDISQLGIATYKQLKGFVKTVELSAGESSSTLTLQLTQRDFSVFDDVKTHAWVEVQGSFRYHIGSSLDDIRLAGEIINE